jgi:hypothetical protein
MADQACMESVNALIPVYTALAGAGVTGVIGLSLHLLNKRFEERKIYKEIIIKTAIDSWKAHTDIAIELWKQNKKCSIMPFESYVISNAVLFDRLNHATLTKNTASDILKDISRITETVDEHYKGKFVSNKADIPD